MDMVRLVWFCVCKSDGEGLGGKNGVVLTPPLLAPPRFMPDAAWRMFERRSMVVFC